MPRRIKSRVQFRGLGRSRSRFADVAQHNGPLQWLEEGVLFFSERSKAVFLKQ